MHLENVVFDAVDPRALGRFWEAALGTQNLTDSPDGFETRLNIGPGQDLDLCFQPVGHVPAEPLRMHLDLAGGLVPELVVERLEELGATHLDVGQGEVAWTVMADVEGNPFCVLEDRAAYAGSGQVAAFPLASAVPERDQEFWSWLTGWRPARGTVEHSLRHPTGVGPVIELVPETRPQGAWKNRIHFDVRLDEYDDAEYVHAEILRRGGTELVTDWGDLPWTCWRDPSGNEFCVLGAVSEFAALD
ncbi:VOC family protein [Nocardioides yefusunii]|uniref:VOC family protein n=1 Tax=Nocardioides yefusunii TaxID=2500546 RepID=A0ABW1R2X6_9ACTN|nr:VOC family protein [Nocardioides yefusunii]